MDWDLWQGCEITEYCDYVEGRRGYRTALTSSGIQGNAQYKEVSAFLCTLRVGVERARSTLAIDSRYRYEQYADHREDR